MLTSVFYTYPYGPSIMDYIDDIEELENMFVGYYTNHIVSQGTPIVLTPYNVVLWITNFSRSEEYNGFSWFFTTASPINTGFVEYVKTENEELYKRILPFNCSF